MKRVFTSLLLLIVGIIFVGVTVLANKIGIDHNSQWGKDRVIGLIAGILFIISAFIVSFCFSQIAEWMQNNLPRNNFNDFIIYIRNHRMKLIYISIALVGIGITVIYIWFISVGTWTNWSNTQDYRGYYYQLATAFDHGQLYIQTKPDPAILSLSNPYDPMARKTIPNLSSINKIMFDASLYNGKLYLYWGPVPAIIIAILKPFISAEISDQYLVFAFSLGLFILQSLLLIKVWLRFFKHFPGWTLLGVMSLCGLINPIPSMLSQPRIYEAAIVGGQFFLMGGIYFAFMGLDRPTPSKLHLALSGIFGACAVGTRAFLLFPITFLACSTIIFFVKNHFRQKLNLKSMASTIIALSLPLVMGGAGLAWYNWARFGSMFEFGLRYQITMVNFNKPDTSSFSLAFIPANIYVYFFNMPDFERLFPFIRPGLAGESSFLYNHLPANYTAEHILGPLYALPFAALGIFVITGMNLQRLQGSSSNEYSQLDVSIYHWLKQSLMGMLLLGALPLLLFFLCRATLFGRYYSLAFPDCHARILARIYSQ